MLLKMEGISKNYGDVQANRQIDYDLKPGEVHAIVGENGAGKTTLMRILYGMEQPSSGTIRIRGREAHFADPKDAIRHGIGMVHQHFMLFQNFTVAENIVIGQEPGKLRFDRKAAIARVEALSEQYGIRVDPRARIVDCPLGVQQRVEILKVLYQGAEIIILDEPTGVLTPLEVGELLEAIRTLTKQGKSFILISHKLNEVMSAADRITVLRDGEVTGVLETSRTSVEELSRLMVGRPLAAMDKQPASPKEKVLEVRELSVFGSGSKPAVDAVSLHVRAGEIVGIAGISGNGQSELLQAISGLTKPAQGTVSLLGTDVTGKSAREFRNAGLAHIPEDRYVWGANKAATVAETGTMGHQRKLSKLGFLQGRAVKARVSDWIKQYAIKAGSPDNETQNLSGGNLQKLIVAREIAQRTPFLIAAEPTRGVDIGAMETIHEQLLRKRDDGGAILLVSSELSEILKLSDRILVMYEGRIVGELQEGEATEEKLSLLMVGGKRNG
ncbi:ABC transporter ATP-binding protein [Cohnella cellulosilytica]|uniref:ABC transporter ATP-binding protein n=1 Tax=Cohnella cellulosilytica TaxID=986710 RepID=A0ABW2F7G5_9BACL